MKILKIAFLLFLLVSFTSCSKEHIEIHKLMNINGKITVEEKDSGKPINNAIVVIMGVSSVNHGFNTNLSGVANISIPMGYTMTDVSQFPQSVDIGADHDDYYSNTYYGHHIYYEKIDMEISGNTTTYYYNGSFVQTLRLEKYK